MNTRRRNHLIWIGPLVAVIGLVSYFLVFARYPVLRDFPWLNLPLTIAGVALSALGLWRTIRRPEVFRGRVLGSLGLAVSLFVGVLFCLYIFRITYSLPAPTAASLSLEQAPDFALTAAGGETVRLSDYRGRKVVLVFYRGFW